MARTEDVLTLFLASPGDVADERNRFEELVNDWNRAWTRHHKLRLEVIRWESDAYPSVGEDAQDVINRQIGNEYDIFVGMMWGRFGTPTTRSSSGTAEEFERALSKYRSSPGSVEIIFYFKDSPISPSKSDPAELAKIAAFKKELRNSGVLYWEFSDSDQFEKLVGLHIAKHVQNWLTRRVEQPPSYSIALPAGLEIQPLAAMESNEYDDPPEDEDFGYLDYLEIFFERALELGEIAKRLTNAQQELTARMLQRTSEMKELSTTPNSIPPSHAKRLIARAAEDMRQFTNRIDAEVPLFRSAINDCMSALIKASTISVDFNREQTESAKTGAEGLLHSLSQARNAITGLKASTTVLPRMTKELNAAKRQQATALDQLVDEFENGERLLLEAITVIDALLGKQA